MFGKVGMNYGNWLSVRLGKDILGSEGDGTLGMERSVVKELERSVRNAR